MRAQELDFLTRLAKGICAQFGTNCGVVIHDLQAANGKAPIVHVENGHVAARKVGDNLPEGMAEAIAAGPEKVEDHFAFLMKAEDGRMIKNTAVVKRDDEGKPMGLLVISYDITMLVAVQNILSDFTSTPGEGAAEPLPQAKTVNELLDTLIEQSVALVGKPVALMSKEDKVRAIGFLADSGAFLITKSGQKVCNYFKISKYTLYSYMGEAKDDLE